MVLEKIWLALIVIFYSSVVIVIDFAKYAIVILIAILILCPEVIL